MSIVAEHIWLEVLPIQREYDLSGSQVAKWIYEHYGISISRQAVNSKLDTLRNWQPRKKPKTPN